MARLVPVADHPGMEVISPARSGARPSAAPILVAGFVGTILVVFGLTLAYVVFATPALTMAVPTGRTDAGQMAFGMAVWTIALVAPSAFILLGANRLANMLASVRDRKPRRSAMASVLSGLPDDVIVASGIVLPDGRPVPDLIVGSFGAAIIRELPPAAAIRIVNGLWQLRTQRGWVQLDDPLARTVRDAERVRRWLAHDDADFVVKTYAAVISRDLEVERTPACAVVTPDQLAGWIAALPPQRSLTEGRRDQILDRVREAAAAS
jgi:hypothetical protein